MLYCWCHIYTIFIYYQCLKRVWNSLYLNIFYIYIIFLPQTSVLRQISLRRRSCGTRRAVRAPILRIPRRGWCGTRSWPRRNLFLTRGCGPYEFWFKTTGEKHLKLLEVNFKIWKLVVRNFSHWRVSLQCFCFLWFGQPLFSSFFIRFCFVVLFLFTTHRECFVSGRYGSPKVRFNWSSIP